MVEIKKKLKYQAQKQVTPESVRLIYIYVQMVAPTGGFCS